MSDIKNYLEQSESLLIAKKNCKLIIDLLNYKIGDDILIEEEKGIISVNSVVSKVEFDDIMFNIVLDYPCDIYVEEGAMNRVEDYLEIDYQENDTILKAKLDVQNIKEQSRYTERLLGGKEIYKDTPHLFRKLYKVYGPVSDMDLVHMEILLSQVLRSKSDTSLPARMSKPFDPVMMNIKEIVHTGNFASSLQFENINKAISEGLIKEEELPPSILEKLMTGDLTT